jgi:hypothetical protein
MSQGRVHQTLQHFLQPIVVDEKSSKRERRQEKSGEILLVQKLRRGVWC